MGTRSLVAAALLTVVALPLAAQGRPQTREGFWIGFGLGYGSLGCEGCNDRTGAVSGYFKLGGTVSRKVLIGGELNGWTKEEGPFTLRYGHASGVIYWYPNPAGGFYLKGGAGFATVEGVAFGFSDTEVGGGLILGLGFDARVARNFSLTPYFNAMGGSFDGGNKVNLLQFGLGLSWH